MSFAFRFVGGIASLMLVSLVSGCGGVKAPVEKLVNASGVIKLDGKPAEAVRIRFTPINETKTVGDAWAVTKEDGSFTVTHWSNKEGVTPGSYQITFSKLVKQDGTPLGANDSPALVQAKEVIAPQWSNPEPDQRIAVTRRVDIPESGKTDIQFSIASAKK
ncbi:MAG: hypothetical protein Q8K78_02715 [Planctomycetaceae bacterium]|nr:hypothetical protein [Planctomycetaceae bacterium]